MIEKPKSKQVSFRVSDRDYDYLYVCARMVGMSVSQYVRMLCNTAITAVQIKEQKGELSVEDFKKLRNG